MTRCSVQVDPQSLCRNRTKATTLRNGCELEIIAGWLGTPLEMGLGRADPRGHSRSLTMGI